MTKAFEAIVVGARCAGSPTAMLLARKGYRVLVVDRATFPSDTVSTHILHPLGVNALSRWGLLDRLTATGCPPIHTYRFDFGPFTISGSPGADKALLGPQITNHFAFLESELHKRDWFAGAELTAADVQLSFPIEAADARVGFAGRLPKLKGFVERVQARPAYKRALERGGPQTFLK